MRKRTGHLTALAGILWLAAGHHAYSDSITVGDTTYVNVLVYSSSTSYYVRLPELGRTIRFSLDEVDAASVAIDADEFYRDELKYQYEDALAAREEADAERTVRDPAFKPRPAQSMSSEDYYDLIAQRDAPPLAPKLQFAGLLKEGPYTASDDSIVVVEFWATWCPPCRTSIPHITRLQRDYGERGVVFVGVTNESRDVASPFVQRMGDKMNYTVALDARRKTSRAFSSLYGVSSIPHAYVVDRTGAIVWHGHPMNTGLTRTLETLTASGD